MAITDYPELQQAVTDWLEDRTDLEPFVPDFIRMGEGYINTELRVRQMETAAPLTPDDSGVAALPDDFLEVLDVTTTATRQPLSFMTRGTGNAYYGNRGGVGAFYGITGSNLTVYPASSAGLSLVYYAAVPALSEAAPTNWLLASRPELHLRASLMHAAEFVKDDSEAAKQKQLADMIIAQMQRQDQRARGRGGIQLRGPTP